MPVLVQKFLISACIDFADIPEGVWIHPSTTVEEAAAHLGLVRFQQPKVEPPTNSHVDHVDAFFLIKQFEDFYIAEVMPEEELQKRFVLFLSDLHLFKLTVIPVAETMADLARSEVSAVGKTYSEHDPVLAARIRRRVDERHRQSRKPTCLPMTHSIPTEVPRRHRL